MASGHFEVHRRWPCCWPQVIITMQPARGTAPLCCFPQRLWPCRHAGSACSAATSKSAPQLLSTCQPAVLLLLLCGWCCFCLKCGLASLWGRPTRGSHRYSREGSVWWTHGDSRDVVCVLAYLVRFVVRLDGQPCLLSCRDVCTD